VETEGVHQNCQQEGLFVKKKKKDKIVPLVDDKSAAVPVHCSGVLGKQLDISYFMSIYFVILYRRTMK
jgi:hypothetical protein